MASNINVTIIDTAYPVAGQDNDSQGFRDNFFNTNENFKEAKTEIEELQSRTSIANYNFDPAQLPTIAEDNYVLAYNSATGLISLTAGGAGGGLANVVEDLTPQLGGDLDGNGFKITNTNIDFLAFSETINTFGTAGTVTIDLSAGSFFYSTGQSTGSITFEFINQPAGRLATFNLLMIDAATYPPTWPVTVEWPGGIEPTWSSSKDLVGFVTYNNGSTWLGMVGGIGFA